MSKGWEGMIFRREDNRLQDAGLDIDLIDNCPNKATVQFVAKKIT